MPLKVYYLDDEPVLLEIFTDLFASESVSVRTFENPDEFLSAVQKDPPDLTFLDYRLGKVTGDEVALRMSESIPKAMITGEITTAPLAKFDRIFGKPYKIPEIEAFIASYRQKAA